MPTVDTATHRQSGGDRRTVAAPSSIFFRCACVWAEGNLDNLHSVGRALSE